MDLFWRKDVTANWRMERRDREAVESAERRGDMIVYVFFFCQNLDSFSLRPGVCPNRAWVRVVDEELFGDGR